MYHAYSHAMARIKGLVGQRHIAIAKNFADSNAVIPNKGAATRDTQGCREEGPGVPPNIEITYNCV
jgi:hypothetical protein